MWEEGICFMSYCYQFYKVPWHQIGCHPKIVYIIIYIDVSKCIWADVGFFVCNGIADYDYAWLFDMWRTFSIDTVYSLLDFEITEETFFLSFFSSEFASAARRMLVACLSPPCHGGS